MFLEGDENKGLFLFSFFEVQFTDHKIHPFEGYSEWL